VRLLAVIYYDQERVVTWPFLNSFYSSLEDCCWF
jgi:hypothetical protein